MDSSAAGTPMVKLFRMCARRQDEKKLTENTLSFCYITVIQIKNFLTRPTAHIMSLGVQLDNLPVWVAKIPYCIYRRFFLLFYNTYFQARFCPLLIPCFPMAPKRLATHQRVSGAFGDFVEGTTKQQRG